MLWVILTSATLVSERRNSSQLKLVFLLCKAANTWKRSNEETDPRRVKSPVLHFTAVLPVRLVATPALPAPSTVVPKHFDWQNFLSQVYLVANTAQSA